MMAAPPQLDAIEESPLKGCALLGSPVLRRARGQPVRAVQGPHRRGGHGL